MFCNISKAFDIVCIKGFFLMLNCRCIWIVIDLDIYDSKGHEKKELFCPMQVFLGISVKADSILGPFLFLLYILNHTSNAKSNRTFNITYVVSSIVTQFYQKVKRLFMKMKVELHRSIIPF